MATTRMITTSLRPYSSSVQRTIATKDLQIIKNPGEEYIAEYGLSASKLVGDLRLSHLDVLKSNTCPSCYHLYFLCIKDTTEVLSASQIINYKSLDGNKSNDFQSWSLSWNPLNYKHILPHFIENICDDLNSFNMNSGGCADPRIASYWRKTIHTKVRGPTYFTATYDMKEIQHPDLEFNGITVKKLCETGSKDMVKYDQSIFPYERSKYIAAKFEKGIGRVAYDKDGKTIGIGLVSTHQDGKCEIGPLYCDNKLVAQAIFQDILEEMKSKQLKTIEIRCSDQFEDSSTWIRPFLRVRHQMTLHSHMEFNRIIPNGLNLSKVYVNSNPANAPC